MTKPSKHIIQKQIFKLDIPDKESFNDIANEIQSIFYKEILPQLDEVFTQFAPSDITIQIDQLVLDIGEINIKNIKRELTHKIIQSVENQLHLEFQKMNVDYYSVGSSRINRISQQQSQLRLLSYFLETGRLPWWANKSIDLNELFTNLIQEQPSLIRSLIYRLATNKYIRKRIIYQFSNETIDALFKVLTPQQANFFRTYVEDLQEVHEHEQVVNDTSYKFKKVVQELIFIYIIDHQQTAINQTRFAKDNLQKLAKKYRISYLEILEQLNIAFESISKNKSTAFKKIAKFLLDEHIEEKNITVKNNSKKQISTASSTLDFIQILETFLVYGYISNRRFFQSFASIEVFFQSLLQEQPNVVSHLIYKIGSSKNVRQRIVTHFEEDTIYELIAVLTPQQAFYFKEHVTSLAIINERTQIVNAKTDQFRKVVQELILKYITERKNSIFDEVDFLRHQIQNLAKNYRLEYDFVLEELKSVIQKNQIIKADNPFTKTVTELYEMDIVVDVKEEKLVQHQPIQTLETYLVYGVYLTDNETDIDSLLYELLKKNSIATKQLIFNLRSNEHVIKRLAHQFSDETTNELFSVISSQSPIFINNFVGNIIHYQQQTPLINEEQRTFQKIIKEFVLIYLLNSTLSTFDQIDFTQNIIYSLAKKYQIRFEFLVEAIQTFFETNETKLSLATTFIEILKTIRSKGEPKQNLRNSPNEQFQLELDSIIEVLETGQLKTSKTKITNQFLEQIIVQKAEQSELREIFKQLKTTPNTIQQLSRLSKKALKKVWNTLSTNKGDYVETLIDTFLKTQQQYRFLELKSVNLEVFLNRKALNFLLYRTFNLQLLTHFIIAEISIKFNVSERQIVRLISKKFTKKDLQKSIETVEKEIIEAESNKEEEYRAFTNLELFEFILNKGYIPASIFYAQKSVDINELFQLLLSTEHIGLQKIARSIQHQPRKISRLVYQLNVENLQQLSTIILVKKQPKWLNTAQQTLIEAIHAIPNVLLPISLIEQLVTEYSVRYLLETSQQSGLTALDFWTYLLEKIEHSISNISQSKLLKQIEKFADIETRQTIQPLKIIVNSKSLTLSNISKTEQTFETFNYILQHGKLPWWSIYKSVQELEKWFIKRSSAEKNQWIQSIEKFYIQSKKTINILTSIFSEVFLNQLILTYSPNFGGIIISYQAALLQVKKSGVATKELQQLIQQFTIEFLVSKRFDLKIYLSASLDFLRKNTILQKEDYVQQISQIAEIASLDNDYRFYALIDMLKDLPTPTAKEKFENEENRNKNGKKSTHTLTEWEIIIYYFQNKMLPNGYQNISYNELMLLIQKNINSHQNIAKSYFKKMFKNKLRLDIFKELVRKEEQKFIFDLINFKEGQHENDDTLTEWEIIIYYFQNKMLPNGYQNISYNELMLLIQKNINSHQNVAKSYFKKMLKNKSRLDIFKQLVRKEEQKSIFDLIDFKEDKYDHETHEINKPKKKPLTIDEPLPPPVDEDIYISNAGIILIHPLLSTLFSRLNLLVFRKWKNEAAQQRAILLLHYIATERTSASEPELVLGKLLCGWELWKPLELELDITDVEANMCQSILKGILHNWERMRSSTPEALRQTFIRRGGKLKEESTQWLLTVEKETFDMLLTTLDWQISMINFSWMPKLLRVHWTS